MVDAKRRPTMHDVARESGVSQATVSLVLNGVAGVRVSELTRARIIKVAGKLNYRRSSRVRAEAGTPSSIGFVIDELSASPFAVPLMEGAREAAWDHGCIVDVISTRSHGPIEEAAIRNLMQRPIAGIIYATLFTREITPPLLSADVPIVLLNCYDAQRRLSSIVPDDRKAAYDLTKSMINAGHRRIGHLAGELFLDAGRDRAAGYRDALDEAGIAFDAALLLNLGSAIFSAYDGACELLDLEHAPTAIFCFNDRMALAVYEAARDRGLHVPHDIAIAGFDNDPLVIALMPSLATAVLPHEAMGRWAVQQIFHLRHAKKAVRPSQEKLECQLVGRKSISRLRSKRQ